MASVGLMEPMLPPEGLRALEDLSFDLVARANALGGQLHPLVRQSVGALVRSMNCYYSNLIEGHDTHPRDIDRALAQDYSKEPKRRALQLEAVAHIAVQGMIDEGKAPDVWPASSEYARWLHREFCSRLPEELLVVTHPETNETVRVEPGALRTRGVQVGHHVPPDAADLPRFLARFEEAYAPVRLSKIQRIVAVAAAHHRFLWIHPFLDGNGRVARLMSYALLERVGVGSSLWSIARGLARNVGRYKQLLMAADGPRHGDLDGRGTLSQSALVELCRFFIETAVDQVDYMASVLEPRELLRRIELQVRDETEAGRLPAGAFPVLREALIMGEVPRHRVPELTGYQERMARSVTSTLLKQGLLVSDGVRAPFRLSFPATVVERWFPRLYPVSSSESGTI